MIDRSIFHIDWQAFHFLRPEWLWAFIPLAFILILILITNKEKATWKKKIAAHLRPLMFNKGGKFAILFPVIFLLLSASLMILAISGPTWKRTEIPGAKSEAVLYIALDMSRSMLAEDIQPNRIERAKFKIQDLLEANPRARTGLMVFAGTAHPVISICEDYNLILHQIESLTPGIMPKPGSNYFYAFDLIDTVMSRIEAPSTLLLITDEMDDDKANYLTRFVANSPHRIELLTLATSAGAKVPSLRRGRFLKDDQNQDYISRRNENVLQQLASNEKITVNPLTLDKSDVEEIAARISANLVFKSDDEESEEEWEDMGYYLVIPILILIAFWFRKGFMIQLSLVFVLAACNNISSWEDLWYSNDYQAQMLYQDSLYLESSEKYQDNFNKGVALFKSGDIESAIYFFSQDSTTANSQYNLGLAYARLGYYDDALKSFKAAADLDPDIKDIARSIDRTEQQIITTDSLAKLTGEPKKKFVPANSEEELKERRAKSEDEELTSDTEVEELPESGDRVTDVQETGIRKAEELTKVPEDFNSESGDAIQDVLLRKISADPSEFLKRKFEYQFDKYYKDDYVQGEYW